MSRAEGGLNRVGDHVFDQGTTTLASRDRPFEQSTAGTVHDLGNLIQVASSALNRVARDPGVSTTPALEPVIASAKTALLRAGALVRETISKAQGGHHETEKTSVGACLIEVEALVQSAWEPSVRLEIRVASDLPPARCDRLGLQNAILNLLFNAREAMPDGGLISVDATAVVRDSVAVLELRVEDGGIGMMPETMVRAFDPFFTTKGNGLGGVGLPMVKRFTEEHGGSVEVESTFGAGTIVILRLPAAR
jgi:signal transduction histidine kinase